MILFRAINMCIIIVGATGIYAFFALNTIAKGVIKHNGFPEDSIVQSYVQYAYEISGGDIDFVTTLEAENGLWNPHRQSEVPDYTPGMNRNGKEDSRGFCQLHRRRHKNIVDNPRFFSDPYWQLDQCYKKYAGGTRFYGYDVRRKVTNRFSFNGQYVAPQKVTVKSSVPTTVNTYMIAKKEQDKLHSLINTLKEQKGRAKQAWRKCIDDGACKE